MTPDSPLKRWALVAAGLLSLALAMLGVLLSAWQFRGQPWLQVSLLTLGAIGVWVVWRIPTRQATAKQDANTSHSKPNH